MNKCVLYVASKATLAELTQHSLVDWNIQLVFNIFQNKKICVTNYRHSNELNQIWTEY
jgi:hypothetical protein